MARKKTDDKTHAKTGTNDDDAPYERAAFLSDLRKVTRLLAAKQDRPERSQGD